MQDKVYRVFESVDFENPDLFKLFYSEDKANKWYEELKRDYPWQADTCYVAELDIE